MRGTDYGVGGQGLQRLCPLHGWDWDHRLVTQTGTGIGVLAGAATPARGWTWTLNTTPASDPTGPVGLNLGLSLPALDGGGSPSPRRPEYVSPERPHREREGHPGAGMGSGGGATLRDPRTQPASACRATPDPPYGATAAFRPCSTAASSRKLTG